MASVRYRARAENTPPGCWLRFEDASMDEVAWAAIWGHDFDVAFDDQDQPDVLVMLTLLPKPQSNYQITRTKRKRQR